MTFSFDRESNRGFPLSTIGNDRGRFISDATEEAFLFDVDLSLPFYCDRFLFWSFFSAAGGGVTKTHPETTLLFLKWKTRRIQKKILTILLFSRCSNSININNSNYKKDFFFLLLGTALRTRRAGR